MLLEVLKIWDSAVQVPRSGQAQRLSFEISGMKLWSEALYDFVGDACSSCCGIGVIMDQCRL